MGGSDNLGDGRVREEKQSCDYKGGLYTEKIKLPASLTMSERRMIVEKIGRMAKGNLRDCARGQSLGRREQWTALCSSIARARLGCTDENPRLALSRLQREVGSRAINLAPR